MSAWTPLTIRDLGKVVTGKTPPTDNAEYYEGDELFVSPKDLTWNSYYVDSTTTRISEKALDTFKGQVIPRDAVMFTSLSFAFGKMGIASCTCITNQQINSIIVNEKHSARFVYYLLRVYEPYIFAYNSGIDTPIVPKSVFERIPVLVPNKATQEKIASLLSAYDDLIANNQRRIALLVSMAEDIYREWFVRMRFPEYSDAHFVADRPSDWKPKRIAALVSRRPYGRLYHERDVHPVGAARVIDPIFLS
jgi:type I restriction enzyme S subunit